jgi:hypothetical protein
MNISTSSVPCSSLQGSSGCTPDKAVIKHHQWRFAMELILIVVLVVLLFGGGGYWGRSRGHW